MSGKYSEATTVRFTPEVREKLKELANETQTSEGSIIRQAVSKLLKEYK